jgi:hypothetical protein
MIPLSHINWVELDIVSIFWGIEFQVFRHACLTLKLSDEFRGVCDWFERVQKHGLGFRVFRISDLG